MTVKTNNNNIKGRSAGRSKRGSLNTKISSSPLKRRRAPFNSAPRRGEENQRPEGPDFSKWLKEIWQTVEIGCRELSQPEANRMWYSEYNPIEVVVLQGWLKRLERDLSACKGCDENVRRSIAWLGREALQSAFAFIKSLLELKEQIELVQVRKYKKR